MFKIQNSKTLYVLAVVVSCSFTTKISQANPIAFCGTTARQAFAYSYGLGVKIKKHGVTGVISRKPRTEFIVDLPVVKIGNIAVGGRAKTPFSMWTASMIRKKIESGELPSDILPVVVKRGFGGQSQETKILKPDINPATPRLARLYGDEAVEILHFSKVHVAVSANRVKAIEALKKEFPNKKIVIIAEDSSQNPLVGEREIILYKPSDLKFGGLLREPPKELNRADHQIELTNTLVKQEHYKSLPPKNKAIIFLSTRANGVNRVLRIKNRFGANAHLLKLRDHSGRKDMILKLEKTHQETGATRVTVGRKEAVKLFTHTQLDELKNKGSIKKTFAGIKFTFYFEDLKLNFDPTLESAVTSDITNLINTYNWPPNR